jgi:UDP-N-acetylmuramoyl-tripeptide--D-alanyl-D-alanine ligase
MTTAELYKIYLNHPLVCTDTRLIKKDSLFFCLKGNNFNGNAFADDALEKGAAYVIIDEPEFLKNEKYILVKDTLSSLQELAKHHITKLKTQNSKLKIIGITGTNGKTTTKELIYSVLGKKYRTVATAGNLNNHIGVPLSILSVNDNTEIAIIEMGANHPGEIAQLCEIACPEFGLITNIGIAHIEGFGSFENIVATKKALYDYISKINGILFVNGNDSLLMKLSENINRITFGNTGLSGLDCYAELLENNPFVKLKWNSNVLTQNPKLKTHNLVIQTNLIGAYNLENILAAICIGKYFKVSDEQIKQGLEEYKPDSYRSQFIDSGRNKIIMDAYNANPASMELAVNNFAGLNFDNKVAIIGDMFELGKNALSEHEKIIRLLRKQKFEKTILVGPLFSEVNDGFQSFPDSEATCQYLKSNPLFNKTILIKGSRGMKMEKILEAL